MFSIKIISKSEHTGESVCRRDISTVSQITSIRDQYRCSRPTNLMKIGASGRFLYRTDPLSRENTAIGSSQPTETGVIALFSEFFSSAESNFYFEEKKNRNFTQQYTLLYLKMSIVEEYISTFYFIFLNHLKWNIFESG